MAMKLHADRQQAQELKRLGWKQNTTVLRIDGNGRLHRYQPLGEHFVHLDAPDIGEYLRALVDAGCHYIIDGPATSCTDCEVSIIVPGKRNYKGKAPELLDALHAAVCELMGKGMMYTTPKLLRDNGPPAVR